MQIPDNERLASPADCAKPAFTAKLWKRSAAIVNKLESANF